MQGTLHHQNECPCSIPESVSLANQLLVSQTSASPRTPLTPTPTFSRLFIKQNLNSTKRKLKPSIEAAAKHPRR